MVTGDQLTTISPRAKMLTIGTSVLCPSRGTGDQRMQAMRRQAFQDWVEHQSEDQLVQLIFVLASQLQKIGRLSDADVQRVFAALEEAGILDNGIRAA